MSISMPKYCNEDHVHIKKSIKQHHNSKDDGEYFLSLYGKKSKNSVEEKQQ